MKKLGLEGEKILKIDKKFTNKNKLCIICLFQVDWILYCRIVLFGFKLSCNTLYFILSIFFHAFYLKRL